MTEEVASRIESVEPAGIAADGPLLMRLVSIAWKKRRLFAMV